MNKKVKMIVAAPYVVAAILLIFTVYCIAECNRLENDFDVFPLLQEYAEDAGYPTEFGQLCRKQASLEQELTTLKEQEESLEQQCTDAEQETTPEVPMIQDVVDSATRTLNAEIPGTEVTGNNYLVYKAHWKKPDAFKNFRLEWVPIRTWSYADQVDGGGELATDFDFVWVCRDKDSDEYRAIAKSHYNSQNESWSNTTYIELEQPSASGDQLYYDYSVVSRGGK